MKLVRILRAWTLAAFLACLLFTFALTPSGCGYILHPERRNGNHTQQLDGVTVAFDCLWLLAGIIPGVVAIVVDAIEETWYRAPGERAGLEAHQKNGRLAWTPAGSKVNPSLWCRTPLAPRPPTRWL